MANAATLARQLKTPRQVQQYLRQLGYNRENSGPSLMSAETALGKGKAHCFEAAFIAAAVLEWHGYLPLVFSLASQDGLDHVVFLFQDKGRWGAIGRSRDEGLHGRAPVFRSLRDLAWSYFDPYIDKTGRITAYQWAHLDSIDCDWRNSPRNVWKAEKYLIDLPHQKLKSSNDRYKRVRENYIKKGPLKNGPFWW